MDIASSEPDLATEQPQYGVFLLIPKRLVARYFVEKRSMVRKHRRILNGAALLALAFAAGLPIAPAANADDTDPPTRVGRIALIQGTVSFHPSPDDQWTPAELNYPVAQSTAIWADTDGEAEIGLGEARIRLASGTELDVVQLDDQNVILSVPQGRIDIALQGMTDGERYDIQTPRGDVDLLSDGNYRVFAGTDTDPTRVASFSGQAQLVGAASSITVAANQEMVATPGTPVAYSITGTTQDDFDNRFFQAVAVVYARPVPAYVPPVPGVEELPAYGAWRDDPQYGHIWVPNRVEAGWQPYRRGHWGFVAPWGYTWIDDAPWGFAPFHYGRWVSVGGSWGWVPVERGVVVGPGYRPVYAPALVTFIGNPAALTVGIAGAAVSVGWVPLGPGEPWRPWYPHSDNYLRQANVANVNRTVITNITNTTIINNTTYINQRAAIVVPQAAFAGGRPIAQAAYRIPPAALARPIEPARPATIEKVLPPPVVPAAAHQAILPPAPKLAMAHPAAASAAAFHAHPPPPLTGPRSAIPKPGSNVVPKGTVLPPAAKPLAVRPAAAMVKPVGAEAQPPEAGKPGTAQPGVASPHPEAQRPEAAKPQAQQPGAAKPGIAEPHAAEPAKPEAVKPGATAPHPSEQPKTEAQRPEPGKPGTAQPGVAPPHPEAQRPEPVRPGATAPHPAEAPKPGAGNPAEAGHPAPEKPAPRPQAEAPKPAAQPAEEPKPAAHPAAEPAKPAPHPAAAEPAGHKPGEPPSKEEQKKPE